MTSSVLTSPSFYLLFLIRLLLMVVMAAFLAHWKVVPLNFFCKSSIGCQVLFCHFQTLLYTRETDDRLISMVGGVNGLMNFLSRCSKVLSSTVEIDHLAYVRLCFAKISIISLRSGFLVACCSTWSPSPSSWRPSPSPWPWSWPASTSSPPSQFSSPWFTASLCCQFFLRKLFDRDLKGDVCFDHFYPLKLNP